MIDVVVGVARRFGDNGKLVVRAGAPLRGRRPKFNLTPNRGSDEVGAEDDAQRDGGARRDQCARDEQNRRDGSEEGSHRGYRDFPWTSRIFGLTSAR